MTQQEIQAVLDAHGKWLRGKLGGFRAILSGANLYGADLTDANLSGAILYGATNAPLLASVSWSDQGERGRTLTAMLHDSTGAEPMYGCGCFWGTEADLRQYIADGDDHLRESRTEALDIVSGLMARMIARRKSA